MKQTFSSYTHPTVWILFVLGFTSGLPLLLTGSTLAYWMMQQGVDIKTIGLFSLAALPRALKFLWAPFMDHWQLPFLHALGRRRAWLVISHLALMACIYWLSLLSPAHNLTAIVCCILSIAFFSAIQDIAVLAYQAEMLPPETYGSGEALCVFGYRMGILMAGAGAFYLSTSYAWSTVFQILALCQLVGLTMSFLMSEKKHKKPSAQQSWFHKMVLMPTKDFMTKPGWLWILAIMFFYKAPDHLIANVTAIYYAKIGFSTIDIANAAKVFGMWMSIGGGFIGASMLLRLGLMRSLIWGLIIHGAVIPFYLILEVTGPVQEALYALVALEHITSGMRLTALFALQMAACSLPYAATQLALMSSLVQLGRSLFAASAGFVIDAIAWEGLFYLAGICTFPVLWILFKFKQIADANPTLLRLRSRTLEKDTQTV